MSDATATIVGALIGGGFAIAGALAAVWFQARRAAIQSFNDAVHEILIGLFPEPINWPRSSHQHLQGCMPQMQSAVYKVRFHLRPKEAARLESAWTEYQEWCHQIDDAAIQTRPFYQESMPSIDQKAVFKRHVQALLSL